MLKKTITYTDYDGNERTEDFYFNLSMAELTEMQATTEGGFEKYVRKIIAEKDVAKIYKMFKDLILSSYGEKSPDGKRFIKSKELSEAFSQTEAFSVLIEEMFTNEHAPDDFVNGIVPKNLGNKPATPAPNK